MPKNPGIISSFIGLIIMIFSIKIPAVFMNTIDMVGRTHHADIHAHNRESPVKERAQKNHKGQESVLRIIYKTYTFT